MSKIHHNRSWIISFLLICLPFGACEFNEPFPDPSADFTIWGVNPETNVYEQVTEPFNLLLGTSYDYIVEGTGQQFVFWFGVDGNPESPSPTGNNFDDRWVNHYSSGTVALDNKASYTYAAEGEFDVVLVASSYSFSKDKYKESLTVKRVTVVAPK